MRAAIWLAAALLACVQPAIGGHGTPYKVPGTACADPPVGCFDAELEWGGSGFYRLGLSPDGADGPQIKITIAGREEFLGYESGGTPTCIWFETFEYRGSDLATKGDVFEVGGPISNCIEEETYHGTLRGHFLDFALTFAFPNPEPEVR